jgi:hypothetical protein
MGFLSDILGELFGTNRTSPIPQTNNGYPKLYHFTDVRNIPSIRQYGLLSWYQIHLKGINNVPGSDTLSRKLDTQKGLHDYVRLCLHKDHPMLHVCLRDGRIVNYRWLEIDPYVWYWSANLYSDTNAAAHRAIIDSDPDTALSSRDIQAEVLIHRSLNPKYIRVL